MKWTGGPKRKIMVKLMLMSDAFICQARTTQLVSIRYSDILRTMNDIFEFAFFMFRA